MRIQKYDGSRFKQTNIDPTKIYRTSSWQNLYAIDSEDYMSSSGGFVNFYSRIIYPHAIYNSGQDKTVMVYQNTSLHPYAIEYNHSTKLWSSAYQIGTNPLSATNDDHGGPAIFHDFDGYYHVFYGCHASHTTGCKHAKSDSPNDISSWTAQSELTGSLTYPKIFEVADGTIFLFFREDFERSIYYKSTDNCATWSSSTTYCEFNYTGGHQEYGNIVYDSVNERFHKVFGCRYPNGSPNLDWAHNRNAYYMYMDIDNENWYNSDDALITDVDCETDTLIWDSGDLTNHYITFDMHCSSGKIYAFAPSLDTDGCSSAAEVLQNPGEPRFLYYDGSDWTVSTPFPTHKNPDLLLNCRVIAEDHLQVFLSYLRSGSSQSFTFGGNVEEWEYYNGIWTFIRTVLDSSDNGKYNGRPTIVHGANEELVWFFDEGSDSAGTATKIWAYGDRGII